MIVIPINGKTWLICGGRDFLDQAMFDNAMNVLMRLKGCPSTIVHGAARGADTMAENFAKRMAIHCIPVPADWNSHGKAAGLIRNQRMLMDHKPSLVIAFPGGRGTADMVLRARTAKIDVAEIVRKP